MDGQPCPGSQQTRNFISNKPYPPELSRWLRRMDSGEGANKELQQLPQGSTLRNSFQTHSLLLRPLPCVLRRRKEPVLGFSYPVQAHAQHSLPAAFSLSGLGSPDRDTQATSRECDPRRSSASYLGAGHWACSSFLPSQVSGGKKRKKAFLKVD